MPKIIGICNQKGGTGKTTTAINIASFLGLTQKKTLIVDMDPQANATSGLGLEKTKVSLSVYDCLINSIHPREVILESAYPNLFLLPSGLNLSGAEIELVGLEEREYRLKKSLDLIKEDFDFIIIDAPPSLGLLTLNVLVASHSIIIPIQCEYYALEGLSQLLTTINLVKSNLNPLLEVEGVLLTMADFRTNLTQEVIMEIRKHFPENSYKTIIPRNIKLAESPSFGKPVYFYDRNCLGTKSYWKLTEEILREPLTIGEKVQDSENQGV